MRQGSRVAQREASRHQWVSPASLHVSYAYCALTAGAEPNLLLLLTRVIAKIRWEEGSEDSSILRLKVREWHGVLSNSHLTVSATSPILEDFTF